jgi:hypothetical protein
MPYLESFINKSNINDATKKIFIELNTSIHIFQDFWYTKPPKTKAVEKFKKVENAIHDLFGIITSIDKNQEESTRILYIFKFLDAYELLTINDNDFLKKNLLLPRRNMITDDKYNNLECQYETVRVNLHHSELKKHYIAFNKLKENHLELYNYYKLNRG